MDAVAANVSVSFSNSSSANADSCSSNIVISSCNSISSSNNKSFGSINSSCTKTSNLDSSSGSVIWKIVEEKYFFFNIYFSHFSTFLLMKKKFS